MTAEAKTNDHHHRAAEDELIARKNDRVFIFRKSLHKNRGNRKRNRGEENKGIAKQIHLKGKPVDIDENNARKAEQASNNLLEIQLFHAEDQAGNEDRKEGGRAGKNRSLYAGGVCKTNVEEKILDDRLKAADDADSAEIFLFGIENAPPCNAVDQNGQHARKEETNARKNKRGGNAAVRHNQLVAELNKRCGAAPKRTAKQGAKRDHQRVRKKILFFHERDFLFVLYSVKVFLNYAALRVSVGSGVILYEYPVRSS